MNYLDINFPLCFELIYLIESSGGDAKIRVAAYDHIQNPNLILDSTSFWYQSRISCFFPSTKIHFKKMEIIVHAALFISPATTHSSPESVSDPLGVRFKFRLKRWMRD